MGRLTAPLPTLAFSMEPHPQGMIDLELYHATISLDETGKQAKVSFIHLPRPGDTLSFEGVNYEVQKVVFNLIPGTTPFPFGYPHIFCRAAAQSLGGDSGS